MRKNSIMMVLYEILCLFVPLIITPYISRTIGAEGIGVYSFTYSIVTYFVIFVQLGIKLYGRREIAKVNDSKEQYSSTFWELFACELAMFAIISVIYTLFIVVFVGNPVYRVALIIQYIEIIVALLDISWLYFGIEKFSAIIIRNVLVRVSEIVFIFSLIHKSDDVYTYILIMSGCNLLGVLSMWFKINCIIDYVRVSTDKILRRIKPLLQLFIPVLSTTLFSIVDKTIIGALIDAKNVGYYENAYKIAKIPVVVITALGNVAMPRITKLIADGKESESRIFFDKSMSLIMGITCAMSFGMYSIASVFIPWYLGEEFKASVSLFQILAFMIVFIGWGNVIRTQYMLPKGLDLLYAKSVIYAAIINIFLSIVLVLPLGAKGVAIASLVAEIVICVYSAIKIRKEIDLFLLIKNNNGYIIAGLLMAACVKSVGNILKDNISELVLLICQVALGAVIYVICEIFIEIITKHYVFLYEIKEIIEKITKRRTCN